MSEVDKISLYDDRIVQRRPAFAVQKGALSVNNAPFQAQAQTNSQHTYSVQVPSENTYIDGAINWTSQVGCALTFTGAFAGTGSASETYTIAPVGKSWSYCAFPLQTMTSTMTASINDANVTINSADVLKEVLRLTDFAANRIQRTTPTKLDFCASVVDDQSLTDSTYASWSSSSGGMSTRDELPNGAYISADSTSATVCPYVNTSGTPVAIGALTSVTQYAYTGTAPLSVTVNADGSVTIVSATISTPTSSITLFVAPIFTEKLVLSPFIFSDVHERSTGMFGVQNMLMVFNMRDLNTARVFRQCQVVTTTTAIPITLTTAYQSMFSGNAFTGSHLDVTFLTPSLDLPLPPKSVVPYLEFPRYITTAAATLSGNSSTTLSTNSVTLGQIPDYLIFYCKPTSYNLNLGTGSLCQAAQGDWYLPISKIQLNWDNYTFLSTTTQQQLYEISINNGLEMNYPSWSGRAHSAVAGGAYSSAPTPNSPISPVLQTVGGFVVLKPGRDFALQVGQAPSLIGNFTCQANVTVNNWNANSVTPQLYMMAVNSGFFESQKGSSRIVKGILTEADIISAKLGEVSGTRAMERAVGGDMKGLFSKLGHFVSKALPIAKAVLPHVVSGVQSAVKASSGEGQAGAGRSGGGRSTKGFEELLR